MGAEAVDSIKKRVDQAVAHIKKSYSGTLDIGIMAGTGLGDIADSVETRAVFEYEDIPGFPVPTVESHKGRLVIGAMAGKVVAAFQGRFHLYEGFEPAEVAFPVRVLQGLGAQVFIITNVSGGMNQSFSQGDIMIISDHINLTGENPLVGENFEEWGVRFPDMIAAYDPDLITIAEDAAKSVAAINASGDIRIHRGVYVGVKGPSLETPAEIRYMKNIGGDAVGMSTVQEVIAARHAGMRVLGLSIISNINDPDNPEPATIEGVIKAANDAAHKLSAVIKNVAGRL